MMSLRGLSSALLAAIFVIGLAPWAFSQEEEGEAIGLQEMDFAIPDKAGGFFYLRGMPVLREKADALFEDKGFEALLESEMLSVIVEMFRELGYGDGPEIAEAWHGPIAVCFSDPEAVGEGAFGTGKGQWGLIIIKGDPENDDAGRLLELLVEKSKVDFDVREEEFHGQTLHILEKAAVDKEVYFCPTHPEVRQGFPGECPECGMELFPTSGAGGPTTGGACAVQEHVLIWLGEGLEIAKDTIVCIETGGDGSLGNKAGFQSVLSTLHESPDMAIHVDLELLRQMKAEEGEVEEMFDAFGFGGMRGMTMSVAFDKTGFGQRMVMEMTGGRKGMFAMYGDPSERPDFSDLIPRDAASFAIVKSDWKAFWAAMREMSEEMDILAAINEQLGVDIEKDFYSNLGNYTIMYGKPDPNAEEGTASAVSLMSTVDDNAIRIFFKKLFDKQGVTIETENYLGREIWKAQSDMMGGMMPGGPGGYGEETYMCITDGYLIQTTRDASLLKEVIRRISDRSGSIWENEAASEMMTRTPAEFSMLAYSSGRGGEDASGGPMSMLRMFTMEGAGILPDEFSDLAEENAGTVTVLSATEAGLEMSSYCKVK